MCAYILSKKGYRGNHIRSIESSGRNAVVDSGLPSAQDILKTTMDNLVRIAGIDVKYNSRVGEGKLSIESLKNRGYKAVFLAKGTPAPTVLTYEGRVVGDRICRALCTGIPSSTKLAMAILSPITLKIRKLSLLWQQYGFRCCQDSARFGGEVTMVTFGCEDRASKDAVPASETEVRGAWEEGIKILYSRGVRKIIGEGGRFKRIESPKCTSVFNDHGFNPGTMNLTPSNSPAVFLLSQWGWDG